MSPMLTAGTISSGGVMGKMISPQSLTVGAHTAVGILAMIGAYVIPVIVPTP